MPRRTRWVAAAVPLVVVAVAAVDTVKRGVSWRDQFPVVRVVLSGQDHLTLMVGTCGRGPELDLLREQSEVVEVAVVSTRTFGGAGGTDCLDPINVRLQAPLGDRRLVDATTGDDLAVEDGSHVRQSQ